MKTVILAALAALAVPAAAAAQDAAAATLPNTFDQPAAQTPAPAPAATPDPRAEPALRAFIAGAQAGNIDTSVLTDDLVEAIEAQSAQVTPLLQSLGAVETVGYVGKESGADLFNIRFENAATQWVIGFNEAGKIGALLFRPAPTQTPAEPAAE